MFLSLLFSLAPHLWIQKRQLGNLNKRTVMFTIVQRNSSIRKYPNRLADNDIWNHFQLVFIVFTLHWCENLTSVPYAATYSSHSYWIDCKHSHLFNCRLSPIKSIGECAELKCLFRKWSNNGTTDPSRNTINECQLMSELVNQQHRLLPSRHS